jgi:hypothetical protein
MATQGLLGWSRRLARSNVCEHLHTRMTRAIGQPRGNRTVPDSNAQRMPEDAAREDSCYGVKSRSGLARGNHTLALTAPISRFSCSNHGETWCDRERA